MANLTAEHRDDSDASAMPLLTVVEERGGEAERGEVRVRSRNGISPGRTSVTVGSAGASPGRRDHVWGLSDPDAVRAAVLRQIPVVHEGRRTVLKLALASLGQLAGAGCLRGSAMRDDTKGGSTMDAGIERTKADALRFYEHLNRALKTGNLAELDAVIARHAVDHNPVPGMKQGLEGIKAAFAEGRAAFPDLVFTVEDVIAEGDKAACRLRTRATHRGTFMGVPATGKVVASTGIDILRFEGGKLVERWGQFDDLALLAQLGLAPR